MKFLLDEQLHPATASALSAMELGMKDSQDVYRHIYDEGAQGALDDELPPLCKERGFEVLVSHNHRDFGARKHYYASLLGAGVHVIVLRPGRVKFDLPAQVSMMAMHRNRVRHILNEAEEPTLLRVSQGEVKPRALSELLDEIGDEEPKLP